MLEILLPLKRIFLEVKNHKTSHLKTKNSIYTLIFLFISLVTFAQNQTAIIKGIILDENNKPVENVNVSYKTKSATTNANGFYQLKIPANLKVVFVFTHVTLKSITASVQFIIFFITGIED